MVECVRPRRNGPARAFCVWWIAHHRGAVDRGASAGACFLVSIVAQSVEITTGVILAAGLAVVSPVAILAGVFIAIGRSRQRQDTVERTQGRILERIEELRDSDTAVAERLRGELDGHAKMLAGQLGEIDKTHAKALHDAVRSIEKRVGSLERWRQRVLGAEQARAAHSGAVPQPIYDQQTPVMQAPIATPRVHQSSTRYKAMGLEDSGDEDDHT